MRNGCTCCAQPGKNVQLESPRKFVVWRPEIGAAAASGIVHENVQSAEASGKSIDERFSFARFQDVGRLRKNTRGLTGWQGVPAARRLGVLAARRPGVLAA